MAPIPLPNYLTEEKDRIKNFSLYFYRFSEYESAFSEVKKDTLQNMVSQYEKISSPTKNRATRNLLEKKHQQQTAVLDFARQHMLTVIDGRITLKAPLCTGLGLSHPTETGMVLDRNLGIPYIPASSLKGACRFAHCVNIAQTGSPFVTRNGDQIIVDENEPGLRMLFGASSPASDGQIENMGNETAKKGELVLLDIYPESIPEIKLDIMTPHFSDYYNQKTTTPTEEKPPIPIQFLTVSSGTQFRVRGFIKPLGKTHIPMEEARMLAIEDLKKAVEDLGLGAKTAIGYGHFSWKDETSTDGNLSKPAGEQQTTLELSQKGEISLYKEIKEMPDGQLKTQKALKLKKIWEKNGKWKVKKKKQKKQYSRVETIKSILGEKES